MSTVEELYAQHRAIVKAKILGKTDPVRAAVTSLLDDALAGLQSLIEDAEAQPAVVVDESYGATNLPRRDAAQELDEYRQSLGFDHAPPSPPPPPVTGSQRVVKAAQQPWSRSYQPDAEEAR